MSNKKRKETNNEIYNQGKTTSNNDTLSFDVPVGYELNKEKSNNKTIVFTKIKPEFPKTWEEFCKYYSIKDSEFYIDNNSNIKVFYRPGNNAEIRHPRVDKHLIPNEKLAKAFLALMQLIQLRDYYNNGWEPNWEEGSIKYIIYVIQNRIKMDKGFHVSQVLNFKTVEIRNEFLENFKDLIEIAKPLL